jgi:hypothetical protein
MTTAIGIRHEIVELFDDYQLSLSDTLIEMLNEHFSHQTERRGCGYTQATRVLATHINMARAAKDVHDLRLFKQATQILRKITSQDTIDFISLDSWRDLDCNQDIKDFLCHKADKFNIADIEALQEAIRFQQQLRKMPSIATYEESKLFAQILVDIILPYHLNDLITLTPLAEKPPIGSCTMAEKFFLEIVYGLVPRRGRVNIIVDKDHNPLFIEKINIGDSHSCLSLTPMLMNGVRLPAGSLFAVEYPEDINFIKPCLQIKGQIILIDDCTGFRFLRVTTLAISSANRKRAFTSHSEWQTTKELFSPHTTELIQFVDIANKQLLSC